MDELERLVDMVLAGAKYRSMAPELVRRIAAEELRKHPKFREAFKATRNRLHQVAGAYLSDPPKYDFWLEKLAEAQTSDERKAVCKMMMGLHASTDERRSIIDEFYATVFADLPPVRSILDVACGLNPLAIPFMPLADGAAYYATDIYTDLAAFLAGVFPLFGVTGLAWAADLTQTVPSVSVDLALILKTIPCLQQIEKGIGARLLDNIRAKHMLVSYPVHSLGGAGKGMRTTYEAQFAELVAGRGWTIRRYDFSTELAFLISR